MNEKTIAKRLFIQNNTLMLYFKGGEYGPEGGMFRTV